ncbi:hypothetical protein Tco_1402811 [Tanacetum coccineum]
MQFIEGHVKETKYQIQRSGSKSVVFGVSEDFGHEGATSGRIVRFCQNGLISSKKANRPNPANLEVVHGK